VSSACSPPPAVFFGVAGEIGDITGAAVIPWTVHIRIMANRVATIVTMVEAMAKIVKPKHPPARQNPNAALVGSTPPASLL